MTRKTDSMVTARKIILIVTGCFIGVLFIGQFVLQFKLPADVRQDGRTACSSAMHIKSSIADAKASFEAYMSAEENRPLAVYSDRENWHANFESADAKMEECLGKRDQLDSLLKRNRNKDSASVSELTKQVNALAKEALALAMVPVDRLNRLVEVRDRTPEMVQAGQVMADNIARQLDEARIAYEAAVETFPDKAEALAEKFAGLSGSGAEAAQANATAKAEMASASPDYGVIYAACTTLTDIEKKFRDEAPRFVREMNGIGKTYSKILVDMRADYLVQIARTSWEESEYVENPEEHTYHYPKAPVDETSFEQLDVLPDDASVGSFMNVFSTSFPYALSQAGVTEATARAGWHGSDNQAEYWLKEAKESYWHCYKEIYDGEELPPEWREVSEEVYLKNWNDLGMALVTKPAGALMDEAVAEPVPAGLPLVGDERYGQWETASNGSRLWAWAPLFGCYAMLYGGNAQARYSESSVTDWRTNYRGQKPYYGGTPDKPVFGTGGDVTRQAFGASRFAQQGGFMKSPPSVREAGPNARAGGPGGAGK